MSYTDPQEEIYTFGYRLAMLVLNPGFVFDPMDPQLPPVPIFQDQQDASAPKGLYVAVQGSPALSPEGYPYVEALDSSNSRGLVQTYTGTLTFWEVNGNGSKLSQIREASFLESTRDALADSTVTILDTSTVDDVSFKLDNAWKMQSRMQMTVSVASRITETMNTVEAVEVDTIEFTTAPN